MRSKWISCLPALLALVLLAPPGDVFADHHSIPEGTTVVVRTSVQISIGRAQPGDIFPATIDEDITVRGETAVRSGEPAEIRLTSVREGSDEIAFRLYTITIGRRTYKVTSDTARESVRKEAQPRQSEGMDTAGKALLGAATGAAVGGVTGGKQGALTGAVTGGGGGLIWSGATKQEANVPAGTFLEFTLREPVELKK